MKEQLQELVTSSNLKLTLGNKLGKGAFGEVFAAKHHETGQKLAVKFERLNGKYSTLQKEAKIMLMLKEGTGFPRARQFRSTSKMDMLVMDRLGPNLEKLYKLCNRRLSLKTVLMIAEQMIDRLEYFHSMNLIHRDIKPENFVVGSQNSLKRVYLIDYGISKLYRSQKGDHITFKEGKGLIGTARYTSLNSHLGFEQSRRDDLEGLGYTLLYFLKGRLEWQNAKGSTKQEKYKNIEEIKKTIEMSVLCDGLPEEFEIYMKYVKNLNFTETPSYPKLKKLFSDLFYSCGYEKDFQYDWIIIEDQSKKLPYGFFQFQTNSLYCTSIQDEEKKDDEKTDIMKSIPYTYQLNKKFKSKSSRRKMKNNFFKTDPNFQRPLRSTSPEDMNTHILKDSYSRMVKVAITKKSFINRRRTEFYTTKTMYSHNQTSKMLNKTHLKFETEYTLLKLSEKEGKTNYSLHFTTKGMKEDLKGRDPADFNSDMEEEGNDMEWVVNKKIQMLAPLEKKLIYSINTKKHPKPFQTRTFGYCD